MSSDIRVALITGGSSGIGLGLTQHLLSKSSPTWHIVLSDLNPPPDSANLPASRTRFIRTNVADWDSQKSCFREAFNWHQRLDFAALNAGIDDRDDIFNSLDHSLSLPDGPRKPNMATFDVNFYAVYYGVKLAAYYFSASPQDVKPTANGEERGNIVITSSAAGLFPNPSIPQYAAAKEALLSLTRCFAPRAALHGMRINALCPAMVPTALAPPGLMEVVPEAGITPMSTIMRAYDEMMGGRNGGIVLANVETLEWREGDWPKPTATGGDGEGVYRSQRMVDHWNEVYLERNRKWALVDWERERDLVQRDKDSEDQVMRKRAKL